MLRRSVHTLSPKNIDIPFLRKLAASKPFEKVCEGRSDDEVDAYKELLRRIEEDNYRIEKPSYKAKLKIGYDSMLLDMLIKHKSKNSPWTEAAKELSDKLNEQFSPFQLEKHVKNIWKGRKQRSESILKKLAEVRDIPPIFEQTGNRRWSEEEIDRFYRAVLTFYLDKKPVNWAVVAEQVGKRDPYCCAVKWKRSLNPLVKEGIWTQDEIDRLEAVVKLYGKEWTKVQELMNGRSDQACRLNYRTHFEDPSEKKRTFSTREVRYKSLM